MAIYGDLHILMRNLLQENTWIDPYDTEIYSSRYLRGILKRALYFYPNLLYKTKILQRHIWDENYILLGTAAINHDDAEIVDLIIKKLFSNNRISWGLPINWHTNKLVLPKGTMMSTTTAEAVFFLVQAKSRYNNVTNQKLSEIGYNFIQSLNRVQEFISYSPLDYMAVNNANLLAAAAIGKIAQTISDDKLLQFSNKLTFSIIDCLPKNGAIPYMVGGSEQTVDAYHQLFSLRALYYLKNIHPSEMIHSFYQKAVQYFEKSLMDPETGQVYLSPRKNIVDLQPIAEALRFYGITKNKSKYEKVLGRILQENGDIQHISQRVWYIHGNFKIKSRSVFTRQGLARLLTGLSYQYIFE